MNNRWSPAARLAALAVRRARALGRVAMEGGGLVPQKGVVGRNGLPMTKKKNVGGVAVRPVVGGVSSGGVAVRPVVGGVSSGGVAAKPIPEKNVWIPPNGGVGTQYEEGMKGVKMLPKPNIFYSSTGPKGPLDTQTSQGIRYDPKNPDHPQSPMPPKRPPVGGGKNIPRVELGRIVIGGKRYTRVGNQLVPDDVSPGGKKKVFYEK